MDKVISIGTRNIYIPDSPDIKWLRRNLKMLNVTVENFCLESGYSNKELLEFEYNGINSFDWSNLLETLDRFVNSTQKIAVDG